MRGLGGCAKVLCLILLIEHLGFTVFTGKEEDMLDTSAKEIQMAIDVVRRCGKLAHDVQSGMAMMGLAKSDFSPVTVGDYAIQAVVGHALMEAFPDDKLVAEESADGLAENHEGKMLEVTTKFVCRLVPEATPAKVCEWIDHGASDPGGRFWVLDPIDGTKGYLRGGQFAVALALVEDGQVQIGVLGCPNLGENCVPDVCGTGALIVARRGEGTWFAPLTEEGDLTQLRVSTHGKMEEARVLRSLVAEHTNAGKLDELITVLGVGPEPLQMDSMAKCALLASGSGDLLLRLLSEREPDYRERIWDQAAGSLVIEEAGGKITDLEGRDLDFTAGRTLANNRGVLASNGVLHDMVLEGLKTIGMPPAEVGAPLE